MLKYFDYIIFHNTELKSRHSLILTSSEKLSQIESESFREKNSIKKISFFS